MLFDWRIVIAFNSFSRAKNFLVSEAVPQRCSVEKVFLEILQNSQENTCARVSFSTKLHACICGKVFFFQKKPATTLHKFGYVEILLYDFSKGTALKLNQVSNSSHFTGALTYSRVHCSPVLKSLSFESFKLISVTRFAELIQF